MSEYFPCRPGEGRDPAIGGLGPLQSRSSGAATPRSMRQRHPVDAYVHYAVLSWEAAHPSAQSLDRHFIRGRGATPLQGMRWGAYAGDPDEIGLTLNLACLAMLEVCESTCDMLAKHRRAQRSKSPSFCPRQAERRQSVIRR